MSSSFIKTLSLLFITTLLIACGSQRTFHEYARAGDTVAVPIGMKQDFNRNNISVTITPSGGAPIVLSATDPAIRAVVNLYLDPVSSMRISKETKQDLTPYAQQYFDWMNISANNDQDMFQTVVFIDLPVSLPVGLTDIAISNGSTIHSAAVDIVPGTGMGNTFASDFGGGLFLNENMLSSLARVDHATINISSAVVPHAIELELSHDGTGTPFVVNPTGFRKSIFWSDNGTNIKIIMMNVKDNLIDSSDDYKIYISGTVSNLQVSQTVGYDENGNEIPGVTSTITFSN